MTQEEQKHTEPSAHALSLKGRASLTLVGVSDVMSFDDSAALLSTSAGLLSIDGEGLRVLRLSVDEGGMTIEGKINALVYLDRDGRQKKKR